MTEIEIDNLQIPQLRPFTLTDRELARDGLFVVESPQVIARALEAALRPCSVLCEQGISIPDLSNGASVAVADAVSCDRGLADVPVYVAPPEVMRSLTGHALARGMQAAFPLPALRPLVDICSAARRIVVLDNVVDAVNVGSIFRSAAALGMDAVLLTGSTCSPLNRRASRVSMGTVFAVPWTRIDSPSQLQDLGFKTAAMALTDDSVTPDDAALQAESRLAIVMGNEGNGLPKNTIRACDYTVCIPMSRGVDSLNVATAAAIACYALRPRN